MIRACKTPGRTKMERIFVDGENDQFFMREALNEAELGVVRRARNARQTPSKNADAGEYHRATALEALVGYLYVTGARDRMNEILAAALPRDIFEDLE